MALEDIFGSGAQFKGLLSDEDIGSVKNDALLNASLSLLAAGGPSTQKVGIGQALAQAYGSGRRAFRGGIEQGIDAQDLRVKMEDQARKRERQAALQGAAIKARTPDGSFDPKAYFSMAAPYLADPIDSYTKTAEGRVKGAEADRLERQLTGGMDNPFAPLVDTVHPSIKNLAAQYAKSFPTLKPDDVDKRYQAIVDASNKAFEREETRADRREQSAFNRQMAQANLGIAQGQLDMRREAAEKAKAPTEMQSNAQGFADRMLQSENILAAAKPPDALSQVAGALPWIGNVAKNKAMSIEEQKYNQAAQDWIRAKLRKESGAAIGVEEAASEYRTYFPQVGDSQEVIRQKNEARRVATEAMVRSGGPSFKPMVSSAPPAGNKPKADLYNKYGLEPR